MMNNDAIHFRRLWSSDREAVVEHLLRLDPNDRRLRFFSLIPEKRVREYGERIDWTRALMVGAFDDDGTLRGVGELIKDGVFWPERGEIAITVETDHQGRGVGTALLDKLLAMARNRGIRELQMICLTENRRMRRLAAKFDPILSIEDGAVDGRIAPPWPTPMTMLDEAVLDAGAMLRFAVGD